MSGDSAKVPFIKSECEQIADSLRRVIEAITPFQQPMFLGGPLPSAVLQQIGEFIEARAKDAVVRGPIMGATKE